MNSELEAHLARNKELWAVWTDHGVTEDSKLAVEFHFYATKEAAAIRLADTLQSEGLSVDSKCSRTFIIFKGWELAATETANWTLERLQKRTAHLFNLAVDSGASLEGLGAEMPSL